MSIARQFRYILVSWLIFLGAINLVNGLPHQPLHVFSWVNYSLYFLLAMICFFIARKDDYSWEQFAHFGIAFLGISLSFVVYFIGRDYLVGDNFDHYNSLVYSRMLIWNFLLAGVIHSVLRYVFWHLPRWISYGISLILSGAILADFWYKALTIHRFTFKLKLLGFIQHIIRIDIIALLFLTLYFGVLIRRNRPNAAFLNAWMIGMLVLYSCDFFDLILGFYKIDVYGIDQYFATFCLIILIAILFLRLIALESPAHRLREQLMIDSRAGITTPVIIRGQQSDVIIGMLKEIFNSQNIILQLLFAISLLLVSGLSQERIVLYKIFLLIVILGTIWNIYTHIILVKMRKGQIINQKFIKPKPSD